MFTSQKKPAKSEAAVTKPLARRAAPQGPQFSVRFFTTPATTGDAAEQDANAAAREVISGRSATPPGSPPSPSSAPGPPAPPSGGGGSPSESVLGTVIDDGLPLAAGQIHHGAFMQLIGVCWHV